MKKTLKNIFIPHQENDHVPLLFQKVGITAVLVIAFAGFFVSALHSFLLVKNSDFLASVLPSVLVDLTNEDRVDYGVAPLAPNPILEKVAELKAQDMAENNYFAHVSPQGVTPWHWFAEAGYTFTHAGENLAIDFVNSKDISDAWLASPEHRANVLNADFTEIGIATAKGQYNGHETIFVVQVFGRPLDTAILGAQITQIEVPEETKDIVVETKEDVVILEDTETSIVVEALVPTTTKIVGEEKGVEAVGLVEYESSVFERLATQPDRVLAILYILLGTIIFIVLLATIIIEIEKQHPRHIIYAILLLVLLVVLFFINKEFVYNSIVVI